MADYLFIVFGRGVKPIWVQIKRDVLEEDLRALARDYIRTTCRTPSGEVCNVYYINGFTLNLVLSHKEV